MAIRDPKARPRTKGPLNRSMTLYDEAALPGAPAPPPPSHAWRREIVSLSGLVVLAGIWLIIAPWVLGYNGRDPRWNDVILGIIVILLALSSADASGHLPSRRSRRPH